MAWIKFDKDLVDDPRILRAAEELSYRYVVSVEHLRGPDFAAGSDVDSKVQLALMRNAVTGALLTLWVYADTHIRDGDVLPISIAAIDRLVGIDGFYELIGEDWICPSEDGQTVTLPGYCEKNGLISKENRKASNAERQRRFREKSNAISNAVSNGPVTPLDLDLDLDKTKSSKEKASSGKPDLKALAKEVLDFLNTKTGRAYQPVPANVDMIVARLREGNTADDCKAVVAKKCREWGADDKMAQYLRPATLFNRTKFAQYRGEVGNG